MRSVASCQSAVASQESSIVNRESGRIAPKKHKLIRGKQQGYSEFFDYPKEVSPFKEVSPLNSESKK